MKKPIIILVVVAVVVVSAVLIFKSTSNKTAKNDFVPAIIFDLGGKFDKSFNQSAYDGAERFKEETGIQYREFEVTNPAQREQGIAKMAERKSNVIVGIGFSQADAINKVAAKYPELYFAIVDSVVDQPNVQSIVFKEEEGSFLVGVLAALSSKTGIISFVGGMDVPLIRAFACGYFQGAKYINPNIKVVSNMTGNTPAAWNNPSRGSELAKSQFEKGSDIVYAAAGGTGVGVYQAAKDNSKLAIGVDSNQNYLHPGTMLTSMVKRVDVAVYNAMKSAKEGTWQSGVLVLGLAEGGVDWALDEHNLDLVTSEMRETVEKAKQAIIDGDIQVVDYRTNNSCDY